MEVLEKQSFIQQIIDQVNIRTPQEEAELEAYYQEIGGFATAIQEEDYGEDTGEELNIESDTDKEKCYSEEKVVVQENTNAIPLSPQDQEKLFFNEINKYRFCDKTSIPKPIPVIRSGDCIISTAGNLTTIVGESKAGKSGIVGSLLAGSITAKTHIDTLGMTIERNTENRGILHIDTEQSAYDHQKFNFKVLERAEITDRPASYYSYQASIYSSTEIAYIIAPLMKIIADQHNGLHLVIIDGVADLINSVNDEAEANTIVRTLHSLAIYYKIPIVLIMHLNPNSDKGRGHLGSQLERKSEAYLVVKKQKGISKMIAKYLRNGGDDDFGEIHFNFNPSIGYHAHIGTIKKGDKEKLKEEKKKEELLKLAKEVFKTHTDIKYNQFADEIVKVAACCLRTAKTKISEMRSYGILKEDDGEMTLLE